MVLGAGFVVEIQVAVLEGDPRGGRESALIAEQQVAPVHHRGVGERVVGVEVEGVLTLLGQAHVSGDEAGPVATRVILIDDQGTRAGARGDRTVGIGPGLVGEEREDLLRVAVEVEHAVRDGQEVVGLEGVLDTCSKAHGALVDGDLAAERVGAEAGEPVDLRGRGRDDQRACAGLDRRDGAVGDAVAAVHRGIDGQLGRADRPDVERGRGVDLVHHAAGDDGGAAVTDEDAARL